MFTPNIYMRFLRTVLILVFLAGCAPAEPITSSTLKPTLLPSIVPSPTPISLPKITLTKGDYYFNVNGKPAFIFSRNLVGLKPNDYQTLVVKAHQQGDLFVRVGAENGAMGGYFGYGYTSNGDIREDWSKNWENFFDIAEANGMYVLPFFTGWANWNITDLKGWEHNPLNGANGGPAKTSIEIFKKDSPTQLLYLKWFKDVVTRWSKHKNILAWELITEADLITSATESTATYFVEQLAKIAREADPLHRPTTASQAWDSKESVYFWPNFYHNEAIDFINIHPYPATNKLDTYTLNKVRQFITTYHKPILIGESGLSTLSYFSPTGAVVVTDNAQIGIHHAIWAEMVSGAMNGRALWTEDAYAIYSPGLSWTFINKYNTAELSAANFIKDVDFFNFKPLDAQFSATITGAAIGNAQSVIGWFRDASCEPPDWNMKPLISRQNVTITVPGSYANWQVDFYDTKTGTKVVKSILTARHGDNITISLPDFTDDIAFKMYPTNKTATVAEPTNTAISSTDLIAGKWTGTISGDTGGFSTPIILSIKPSCKAGTVCGTVSVPKIPCSGNLFLKEIQGDVLVFIEQNMKGSSACSSGGFEYLQLQADGTLSFKFKFTATSQEATLGVLKRS